LWIKRNKNVINKQNLSVEEVAGIMQVNYQSANNLLHRAIQALRKDWKDGFSLLLFIMFHFFSSLF
jgi:transposase-like protein